MKIVLNGNEETIVESLPLSGFLVNNNLKPGDVVVELNNAIIPVGDYDRTILKENDSLEVLRFVGGG
ncbi:MAG: sulfur carrier protein ThiS [Desulfobacteraceae bacterium]|nr:sulfur carrier protein ThiS [Desulfobacteraceae bacterium]